MDRGEVFTEPREVKAMCGLCEPDISRIDKKVLGPGCGTGNFLAEILGTPDRIRTYDPLFRRQML